MSSTVPVKNFEVENFRRSPFTYKNFPLNPVIMQIISYSNCLAMKFLKAVYLETLCNSNAVCNPLLVCSQLSSSGIQ